MKIFFVNKFNWLAASPMATVSTMSTYSMAEAGQDTILIIEGDIKEDPNEILSGKFGKAPRENYRVIPINRKLFGKFKLSAKLYFKACRRAIADRSTGKNILISRNTNFLPYMFIMKKFFGFECFFETHGYHGVCNLDGLPKKSIPKLLKRWSGYRIYERLFLNKMNGIICITNPQAELYKKDFLQQSYIVLPLAAPEMQSLEAYEPGRNFDKKTIVYTGRLTSHIDADTITEAVAACTEDGVRFVWIGLRPKDIEILYAKIKARGVQSHFELKPWMSHRDMIDYMRKNASVGIAAYKNHFHSAAIVSPTKVFDYFAVGMPVIASDLATLRDVATENQDSVFYRSENAESLTRTIRNLFADKDKYVNMCLQSVNAGKKYSWKNRSRRLIEFIENNS
ncbi:MAG: glycosyltransferase [Chlorobi bacterium]|nr:glycosyltransferase [Chlorobiota bacterium]